MLTLERKFEIINWSIEQFFKENNTKSCKPKDLMPILIKANLFTKDYRSGLPLRNLLRKLDRELDLRDYIPSIRIVRKKINRYWFFDRL